MVDFGSLIGTKKEEIAYDLEKFYAALDVKSTHTEPRPAQREALKQLTERYTDKDLVLKISTGAGKTTIGLLYLYGHMRVSRAPAVYLCPTVQLIEQVLQESDRLGIQAHAYLAGETYPHQACMRGEAVLVCTYEKLFNAKTTFTRHDVNIFPEAIVLDDAHAGVENIRKQFTLTVQDTAYLKLLELLGPSCRAYHKTKWKDIESGDALTLLEVPHWIWSDNTNQLLDLLHGYENTEDFMFVWPYLRDILPLCRCVISGTHAEITPEVLPTDIVRPFAQAHHRLFMSATLADDSLLTRELGASPVATSAPILPPSDRGMGERMILAPSLVDPMLDRDYVMNLCIDLAKTHNVVVLTSSEVLARDWVLKGATYFAGDNFSDGVRRLRDSKSGLKFAVFAQRYDGVDLPDDACRVLVVDGTPYGESLIDKADSQMAYTPGGVRNRTIFRIEQGMGRPVRSHADFAVVLLIGQDLTTYVGRHDVLDSMTHDTRNQLNLSFELADLVRKSGAGNPDTALRQVINQCLGRDQGWKDFYNKRIREAAKKNPDVDRNRISLASQERRAYQLASQNCHLEAKELFQPAINATGVSGDELGIYLQRLARLVYVMDQTEGIKIQQGARERNLSLAIPPSVPRKPTYQSGKTVAEKVCAWFRKFSNGNAAVIEAKRIADSLDLNQKSKRVEAALQKLGEALGADSFRPDEDYSEGPDNLWCWGGKAFVIEAKNENQETLHKKDSGQLHDSLQWTKDNYPEYAERLYPIVVAKVNIADKDANYPQDARVLTGDGCATLGRRLHQFCIKLAEQGPIFLTAENVLAEMQNFELHPDQLVGSYTVPIS